MSPPYRHCIVLWSTNITFTLALVETTINKQRNSGGSLYFINSVIGGLYEVIHVVMYVKVS